MKIDERGATLISVMVAIVILTIAMTMVTSAFHGSIRLTRNAGDFHTASNFAEGVMERVISEPFARINNTIVADGLPALPGAECKVEVQQSDRNLKEVIVTCSWLDGARSRRVTLSTLVARGAL